MAGILNSAILNWVILDSAILEFPLKVTHSCQDWFPPFAQNLSVIHSDSTWWWQPFNSVMLDSDTAILDSDTLFSSLRFTQNTLTPLWLWLKLIQSDSNSFIFTYLDDGGHLEFGHLVFSHLRISSQSHSQLPRLVSTICTKPFTHSFWLNLMMAAILTSTMLGSDTAILDSDTLLSSFRLTQKHSHSNLTLTQTNSIWLKLIHFHLTWW